MYIGKNEENQKIIAVFVYIQWHQMLISLSLFAFVYCALHLLEFVQHFPFASFADFVCAKPDRLWKDEKGTKKTKALNRTPKTATTKKAHTIEKCMSTLGL